MSTKGSALLKQVTNQVGVCFTLASMKDKDKYEYQAAYSAIKRELEEELRLFK
jgi:hypothetical protein